MNNLNELTKLFLQYFESNEPTKTQEKNIFKLMIQVIFEIVIKLDELSKDVAEKEKVKLNNLLGSFVEKKTPNKVRTKSLNYDHMSPFNGIHMPSHFTPSSRSPQGFPRSKPSFPRPKPSFPGQF